MKELAEKIAKAIHEKHGISFNLPVWLVDSIQSILEEHFKPSPDLEAEAMNTLAHILGVVNGSDYGNLDIDSYEADEILSAINQFAQQVIAERMPSEDDIERQALAESGKDVYPDSHNAARDYVAFKNGAYYITSKLKQ